jgi:hypothetical protein
MTAVGGVTSAMASRDAGKTARLEGRLRQEMEQFRARLFTQQAGLAIASSQRTAHEERRRAKLVESRALAVAAASGTDASSSGVMNLIANIAGEGAYRSAVALYEGEERAKQLRIEGVMASWSGDTAAFAGRSRQAAHKLEAAGTIMSTMGSMYTKYARNTPNSPKGDSALIEEFEG